MKCLECQKIVTTKETDDWISHLCKCRMVIIYSDKSIKTITKQAYEEQKNEFAQKRPKRTKTKLDTFTT